MYDAIVVGGGAAGLSAALVLGRARRSTLLLSSGPPRNAPADAAHGMFTRDGTSPLELLRIGREQLARYTSVEARAVEAVFARQLVVQGGFEIDLSVGRTERARAIVLATGVVDELPEIPGLRERWGHGVYHCPYCHGWEVRDQPLGVLASGKAAMHLAPLIRNWSPDVTLLSDGPDELTDDERLTLRRMGIAIRDERIIRLEAASDGLHSVVLEDGAPLLVGGVFIRAGQQPRSDLARQLGCELVTEGTIPGSIVVDPMGKTTVPGVYAAGDVATPMQQVITAAASGAMAAAMLNFGLVQQELHAVAS